MRNTTAFRRLPAALAKGSSSSQDIPESADWLPGQRLSRYSIWLPVLQSNTTRVLSEEALAAVATVRESLQRPSPDDLGCPRRQCRRKTSCRPARFEVARQSALSAAQGETGSSR